MRADDDLDRFVTAQQPVFRQAMDELAAGRKTSHWMWFVFPQLRGLGHSAMARHYGVADLDEARRYLRHPVLGPRLRQASAALLAHRDKSARDLLGSPDDMKLRSSMTLFLAAAAAEGEDGSPFAAVLDGFYGGAQDPRSLEMLGP